MQLDVLDSGASLLRYYDAQNTHPYSQLDITRDVLGHITGANATLDVDVAAVGGSVGQVLGSAIGRALAPNNQFVQLAAGTVAGAIGQKFGQIISSSLKVDGTGIAVGDVFSNFGINLASAGAGSIASFLTAEIGTALGLDGYGAQLFNASVGGFAGSVAQQVALHGMGQIASINWGSVFTSVEVNIGGALGSMLAHQIVQAQTQSGAIGGQIAGAIGSAIGAAIVGQGLGLALNIVIPGLGSLIGTLVGTIIGDLIEGDPQHPYAENTIDPSTYSYGINRYYVAAGGDADAVDQMALAARSVVNAYLSAVNGVALAYSKQVHIGYQTVNQNTPYFWGEYGPVNILDENGNPVVVWTTIYRSSASIDGTINAAAVELVRNTEVIGGDLLLKRAHQHSQYSDTMTLAADLQVAQDYENYLNNREAINALMAANPNSAFTAGWIATFARVNDLGLNHYGVSDFFGGMVMGYLDSVRKTGLNFNPADVSVKHGSDGSVTIEIHVGSNVDVRGALAAFASHTEEVSDATGKTIQLVFTDGLAAGGYHGPASSTLVNGVLQVTAASGNNIWFGGDDHPNRYVDSQASSQDVLVGGALNDEITAGNGFDFVDGGAGDDYVNGGAGNDILRGGAGNDSVYGGIGDDTLVGGLGADNLSGGGGRDTFVFLLGDSSAASGQHDRITDFVSGTDRIDLSGYDAISSTGSFDQFKFISTAAFHGTAGELNYFYNSASGVTTLQGDTNGDGVADFAIDLAGNIAINPADLIGAYATIESAGATSLAQIGSNYYLYANGTTSGPTLKYATAAVTVGQFDPYVPVAVEQTASGYQVVLKYAAGHSFSIWNTDSNGNFISHAVYDSSSAALEALETGFHQDLNGDGTIGVPTTVIETLGSTSLVQVGNNFYLNNIGSGAGPTLKYSGVAVAVGQFDPYVPVAVEQTVNGYQVALKYTAGNQFSIWNTDSNGNFISFAVYAGNSAVLESLESSFHQDLNGDGTIGVPPIEALGSTSLVQTNNNFYLNNIGSGTGPTLKYSGAAVTVGQFDPYVPMAVEQTASGYQVALKYAAGNQFSIWNTDSNGNFISYVVYGSNSAALELLETSFHQDLNGDGTIGGTVIEALGSTSLVQAGNNFYLNNIGSGTGPTLKYNGAAITVGQFDPYVPMAVEQTASGYQVALKYAAGNSFSIWNTDSNGNFISYTVYASTSTALKSLETSFHQDLNGDGVIGAPPVVLDLDGNSVDIVPIGQSLAYFDMDGRSGEERTAWVSSGDGLLAIDLAANGATGADGVINQTSEIVFTSWAPGATSDMAALRFVFDTNHDGALSQADERWSEFRIWQDANGDGVSQAGEVKTLDDIGIASIDLNPAGPSQAFADGSVISGLSNFVWKDGHTGVAGDVSFAHEFNQGLKNQPSFYFVGNTANDEASALTGEAVLGGYGFINGGLSTPPEPTSGLMVAESEMVIAGLHEWVKSAHDWHFV